MPRKTRLVCCQSLEYHTITSLASRFMPDVAKIAQYPILVGPLRFVHFFSIFCHTSCNFTSCLRLIVYNRQWLPCHYRAQPGPRCALAAPRLSASLVSWPGLSSWLCLYVSLRCSASAPRCCCLSPVVLVQTRRPATAFPPQATRQATTTGGRHVSDHCGWLGTCCVTVRWSVRLYLHSTCWALHPWRVQKFSTA